MLFRKGYGAPAPASDEAGAIYDSINTVMVKAWLYPLLKKMLATFVGLLLLWVSP
jgi:hypothetical protein